MEHEYLETDPPPGCCEGCWGNWPLMLVDGLCIHAIAEERDGLREQNSDLVTESEADLARLAEYGKLIDDLAAVVRMYGRYGWKGEAKILLQRVEALRGSKT